MKKTLIITGGSKGIGKSIILKFLEAKYFVINISRTPCQLGEVYNIQADLTENDVELKIKRELDSLLKEKSSICLVHNAAYQVNDSVGAQEKYDLEKSLAVAITLPSLLNGMVIPYMEAGSSIIYIGSTLSVKAVKHAASYIISKHAVAGLMKATCQDLSDYPIHTCCICPGFTETEMLMSHLKNKPESLEFAKSKVGAKRLLRPDEIAEIVYFSSKNPALNGSMLQANLGQLET